MIYTICNSALTACIDETGAQLISLKDKNGTEYIWQRDPAVWSSCSPPSLSHYRKSEKWKNGD